MTDRIHASLVTGRVLAARDVWGRVRPVLLAMWASGDLPRRSGKAWVVGYRVRHRHMGSTYLTEIKMGPKPPSRFREEFLEVTWEDYGYRRIETLKMVGRNLVLSRRGPSW